MAKIILWYGISKTEIPTTENRRKLSPKAIFLMAMVMFMMSGCSTFDKARRADQLELENANLKFKLKQIQQEKANEVAAIVEEKEQQLTDLEKAKLELEESLKKEIGDYKAKLEMTSRGLVITFISEIFFDSGKAEIRLDGKPSLSKVAEVLNKEVIDSNIAIEGHTDNDPIKHSGWATNWELSSARALAVLHYLVDDGKLNPKRVSANGYGEYHPVAANDSHENKQKNRRVEIVILPKNITKAK